MSKYLDLLAWYVYTLCQLFILHSACKKKEWQKVAKERGCIKAYCVSSLTRNIFQVFGIVFLSTLFAAEPEVMGTLTK